MTESSELRESMRELKTSIDGLRNELVRKDVYESDQRGVLARIQVVEKDVEDVTAAQKADRDKQDANRRLILTALALPILVFLIQLYVTAQLGGQT